MNKILEKMKLISYYWSSYKVCDGTLLDNDDFQS